MRLLLLLKKDRAPGKHRLLGSICGSVAESAFKGMNLSFQHHPKSYSYIVIVKPETTTTNVNVSFALFASF